MVVIIIVVVAAAAAAVARCHFVKTILNTRRVDLPTQQQRHKHIIFSLYSLMRCHHKQSGTAVTGCNSGN